MTSVPLSLADRLAIAGVTATVLALWISLAWGGYEQGKTNHSSDATQVKTADGIEFALPHGLALSPPPTAALDALAITPLRVYSAEGDPTQGSVVVGYNYGTGPTLLGTHSTRLSSRSAPQIDEVGENIAVHVTGTLVSAGVRDQAIVYSVPTTSGNAVVLCLSAPNGTIAPQRPDCERVATKLKIAASSSTLGRPISLGQLTAYLRQLRDQLASYENQARDLRRILKQARYSGEQRSLATKLAALCERAARALAQAPTPLDPIVLPVQRSLRTGLTRAAAGYRSLARAAMGRGRRAWALGVNQVHLADQIVAAAFPRLVAE